MTEAENFRTLARSVYGYGWQTKLAKDTGISRPTAHRWANSKSPIPQWAWVFLALKRQLANKEGKV